MRSRTYLTTYRWLLTACVLVLSLWLGTARSWEDGKPALTVNKAVLASAVGQRGVELPHVLEQIDFSYSGSRVRYRLVFDLPETVPVDAPLGIYVPKVSLAGSLELNGSQIGACELGPLEEARCLHRPYLFVPPLNLWRSSNNVLDIEVYATGRQMNGLSSVVIGDAYSLSKNAYWWKRLAKVRIVEGLAWVSLSLGLVALSISLALRGDRLYTWFGVTATAIALSNLNYTVTVPFVSAPVFSWFIFSIQHVTAPLLMLTVLSFFQREWTWIRRSLIAFMLVAPAVIWLSGNDRTVVALLYVPAMFLGPIIAAKTFQWAWNIGRASAYFVALSFGLVLAASFVDWFRLAGVAAFEGVYLVTFVIPSTVLIMGATLASQLAAALASARDMATELDKRVAERTEDLLRLNHKLEELSATDALTGLANRRHFDETLEREWLRARRSGQSLALMVLDVDHFKKFNDTYGHQCGDECLRQLAKTLKARMLRGGDTAARYGGEEFAIITSADVSTAERIAECLRKDVQNIVLPFGPNTAGMVTISIGVAAIVPDGSLSPVNLIEMADAALYQAKQTGRNRVVIAKGIQRDLQ